MYPTPIQEKVLDSHIDSARYVWNLAVEQLRAHYRCRCAPARFNRDGMLVTSAWCRCGSLYGRDKDRGYRSNNEACHCAPAPSVPALMRQLTEARASDERLRTGSVMIQQQALRDFAQARNNWWQRPDHFGPPRFRPTQARGGFRVVGLPFFGGVRRLNAAWASLRIPKVDGAVRFRVSGPLPADPKSARIVREADGQWYVSFPGPQPSIPNNAAEGAVGIDRGVAHTLALSTGEVIDMPYKGSFLTPAQQTRLLRLERTLARRQGPKKRWENGSRIVEPGSNRYEATRVQVARLKAAQRRRRKDWIEQVTTRLVSEFEVIVVEDLRLKNMTRKAVNTSRSGSGAAKRGLNRSLLQQAHGLFLQRLKEKADASGVHVIEVTAANTSRRCAACGFIAAENRVSQARFICVDCGYTANADVNAAQNILERGLGMW